MPPHSSNYCQPLDVSCLAPLKKAYGNLAQNRMRQGFNHMDKLDFLSVYPDARKQAFSMYNIKNGFRATGLVPYNPEEVLGRFTIQLKTPMPPSSQSTNSIAHTPSIKREAQKKSANSSKRQLEEGPYSPFAASNLTLSQLLKACETAMD